jgi:DNA-directed RNA polymerase specialized sigma24 family protein
LRWQRLAVRAGPRLITMKTRGPSRQKLNGEFDRRELDSDAIAAPVPDDDLIALDEALDKPARLDPPIAELVKLRYFANLAIPQAAEILGISRRATPDQGGKRQVIVLAECRGR